MKCKINYDTDPISLTIIAADGYEHRELDIIGNNGFIEVEIIDNTPKKTSEPSYNSLQHPGGRVLSNGVVEGKSAPIF